MDNNGVTIKRSGDWFSIFIPNEATFIIENIGLTASGLLDYKEKRDENGYTIFIKSAFDKRGEYHEIGKR